MSRSGLCYGGIKKKRVRFSISCLGPGCDVVGKKNTNGVEMLKFLESNEMKTLNDRSHRPEAQWTWTRICKDKREHQFWTS